MIHKLFILILSAALLNCAATPLKTPLPEEDQEGGISGTGNSVLCTGKKDKTVECK